MENERLIKKISTNSNVSEKDMKYSFKIMSKNEREENNVISTTKYNLLNFIPIIIMEQFSKQINIYFLIIGILQVINIYIQCFRKISLTEGIPVVLFLLIFVVLIHLIKDLLEDSKKRNFDNTENGRKVFVYNIEKKLFQEKEARDIKLGDVIKVNKLIILGQ